MPAQYISGGSSGGGSVQIPEYATDPVSPSPTDTWVLRIPAGSPIGLLLALTQGQNTYQLSYRTAAGTTVRTNLG